MSQLIDDTVTELIGSTSASDYVPHEWDCDELITAEALNRIEQGIANAGGGLAIRFVEETDDKRITDTTWNQVNEAMLNGKMVLLLEPKYTSAAKLMGYECYYLGGTQIPTNDSERYAAVFVPPLHASIGLLADTADSYLYEPVESNT